jgi:hypothetical protein
MEKHSLKKAKIETPRRNEFPSLANFTNRPRNTPIL